MKMIGRALALLSAVVVFIPTTDAQIFTTVDGGNETRVLDGLINDLSGSRLYVGKTTSGNALHIVNGGKAYNTLGYVGQSSSSANNSAWIVGSGSVWSNTVSFSVGEGYSDGNQLLIELGGRLNGGGAVRVGAVCHNNSAIIRDVGSVLETAGEVAVGNGGDHNSLSILNGGEIICGGSGTVGSSGSNNQLLISGTGSKWVMNAEYSALSAGDYSGGPSCTNNRIRIENGGAAISGYGKIGGGGGSAFVNYNSITVSGSNSTWTMSGYLEVGSVRAIGNRLFIENGAAVSNTDAYVGTGTRFDPHDNRVTVTGAGSVWTSAGEIFVGERWGDPHGANNALYIEDSASAFAKAVTVNSGCSPYNSRMVVSGGFLATENITIKGYANYIALTNAVLRWTSQTNAAPFMTLGSWERFSGTNQIQIAVSSRSAMENVSLDLMSGLDDPADTNLFTVLFLDTSADQLYRPEGATYTFETNSATWSITTDGNTEFVPTPPVPTLFIEISDGNVNIEALYLPEEPPLHLQSSTNLVSGSWSNLYQTSGTTSTNWSIPLPTEPDTYYRLQSD
ncbi:MAG: hypothetical protein DRP64_11680 [Verrucomicrobia bacterium]|nr:MAG: hypothetical protein DRP64_11680 [Verrucomicrobiota bacterium]